MTTAASPPTISLALHAELEKHIGPFVSTPCAGGSSAHNSLPFLITPVPPNYSSSKPRSTNPFHALQSTPPTYVLKVPQNPYARAAIAREAANLPVLQAYITSSSSSSTPHPASDSGHTRALKIPTPAALPSPLPLSALLTHRLAGTDGGQAWSASTSHAERLSLCRAFGRAARWVHSFSTASPDLPGPLRTQLPPGVAQDVHSPTTEAAHAAAWPGAGAGGQTQSTRDWLRLYLRAEAARLAPRFTQLVPDPAPDPPLTSGGREVLEGLDLQRREEEQERAIACISTMERALADPGLWVGGREEACFVHGDWTLPNVLFERAETGEWTESAVVDWGDCGVADRRYDLRMGVWSVLYNAALAGEAGEAHDAAQQEYVGAFLRAYVGGDAALAWVGEDWEAWLEERRRGGGTVKEGYWEAWAAAYDVWGLLEEDEGTLEEDAVGVAL